ncbi:MAG: hypothetical protein AAF560_20890 [Acidobacteriota bacterium]
MRRKGLCDFVVGAAKVQGPAIGRSLGEYLGPVLGAEEALPDLELPIVLLGRKLSGYGDALVEADQEYFQALVRLAEADAKATSLASSLKEKVLSLRSTCRGLLGEESVEAFALDFNVARDEDAPGMLRQGEIVLDRIRNPSIELVPRFWVGSPLDSEAMAQELEVVVNQLQRAVQRVVGHRKQADTAKVRKDQAMDEFDRQYRRIAGMLEAYFRIVDEVELAERIRPTVRRLRGEAEETEETPPAEAPETSDADAIVVSEAPVSEPSEPMTA